MSGEIEVRRCGALALGEFMEWCIANPEAVIALGVSLILLGAAFRLLRVCLK